MSPVAAPEAPTATAPQPRPSMDELALLSIDELADRLRNAMPASDKVGVAAFNSSV